MARGTTKTARQAPPEGWRESGGWDALLPAERAYLVDDYAARGVSAGQAAAALGIASRNAILSVAYRYGIKFRGRSGPATSVAAEAGAAVGLTAAAPAAIAPPWADEPQPDVPTRVWSELDTAGKKEALSGCVARGMSFAAAAQALRAPSPAAVQVFASKHGIRGSGGRKPIAAAGPAVAAAPVVPKPAAPAPARAAEAVRPRKPDDDDVEPPAEELPLAAEAGLATELPAIAAGMPYATYRMFRQCAFPGWVGAFDPATSLVCGAPVEQTPGGDGQDVYCDHHRGVCFTGRVQDAPRGRRQSLAQLVGNAA